MSDKSAMQKVANRVRTLVNKAVLRGVSDGGRQQRVQVSVLKDEVKDNVQRIQNYGFTSNPLPGSQVIMLCLGGDRDHPIAIAVDDADKRPKNLEPGEVAFYHHNGSTIIFRNDDSIELKSAVRVRVDTPVLECTGEIKDKCDTDGKTMSSMRQTYDIHKHNETGTITQIPDHLMGGP